ARLRRHLLSEGIAWVHTLYVPVNLRLSRFALEEHFSILRCPTDQRKRLALTCNHGSEKPPRRNLRTYASPSDPCGRSRAGRDAPLHRYSAFDRGYRGSHGFLAELVSAALPRRVRADGRVGVARLAKRRGRQLDFASRAICLGYQRGCLPRRPERSIGPAHPSGYRISAPCRLYRPRGFGPCGQPQLTPPRAGHHSSSAHGIVAAGFRQLDLVAHVIGRVPSPVSCHPAAAAAGLRHHPPTPSFSPPPCETPPLFASAATAAQKAGRWKSAIPGRFRQPTGQRRSSRYRRF